MDRQRVAKYLSRAAFVIFLGGAAWLGIRYSGRPYIPGIFMLTLFVPVRTAINLWAQGIPVRDVLSHPLSRDVAEATFTPELCHDLHKKYDINFFSSALGIIVIFYAVGFLYLLLCSFLYLAARDPLMVWLSLFQPALDAIVLKFRAWEGTYEKWSVLGAPDMAMFRIHFFGVSFLASLCFIIYQFYHMVTYYRNNKEKVEKYSTIRLIKLSQILYLICGGFGSFLGYCFVFLWVRNLDMSDIWRLRIPSSEITALFNMFNGWLMTVGVVNFFFALMIAILVLRAYIAFWAGCGGRSDLSD